MAKKTKTALSLQERRALHAEKMFEEWLRKSVAASKLVSKWAAKVKYYRKTLAKLDEHLQAWLKTGSLQV